MTKERRLAIEMWEGIRKYIMTATRATSTDIYFYKETFCEDHDLNWMWNCWFCHYIMKCSKCPLKGCARGYHSCVMDEFKDKKVRVEACNVIIKALGGKV